MWEDEDSLNYARKDKFLIVIIAIGCFFNLKFCQPVFFVNKRKIFSAKLKLGERMRTRLIIPERMNFFLAIQRYETRESTQKQKNWQKQKHFVKINESEVISPVIGCFFNLHLCQLFLSNKRKHFIKIKGCKFGRRVNTHLITLERIIFFLQFKDIWRYHWLL